jgi:hypothetical protein
LLVIFIGLFSEALEEMLEEISGLVMSGWRTVKTLADLRIANRKN